ncbi:MAG: glycosyltransferase family 2 protein [Acidobacteriaceae bacterium]|nr:glycosyltransferase family 2 protein [Acidobacteriaceae bacterium]
MKFAWITFSLSTLFVLYIIVLYPALLSLLARIRGRAIRRRQQTPSVSFVIASHNGEAFLNQKLRSIQAIEYPPEKIEIIVVNDGSTDRSAEIVSSYGGNVFLINSEKVGKAGALNQGMQVAKGEILVFTDVRQPLAKDSLRFLVENFADPEVGVASAELQILDGASSEELYTGAYWKYEKWIRTNLSSLDSTFGASGSCYAVRRELAVPIPLHTLNDDMYLPLNAFFKGYRIVLDRRAYMYDFPTDLAAEFGRKVRTLAGNYQVLRYYPQLLTTKNRLLFHYVSYKLGRLFLPFGLLICAVSSLAVAGPVAVCSAVVQAMAYSLAILDVRIPESSSLKRISSPLRSFLAMMVAGACALSIWFVPPQRLWKITRVSRQSAPAI